MIIKESSTTWCCPKCPGTPLEIDVLECHGEGIERGTMCCDGCGTRYAIEAGVPDLVPPEVMTSQDWQLWNDHLAGFAARRQHRLSDPDSFSTRITNNSGSLQRAFAYFAQIMSGPVLDVGCGPGNFRRHLPDGVPYYGVDPLPLKEVSEFPFARAVAEYLPFADNTFRHVVVKSALDHFRDVPKFCREVLRVLQPQGRLHVVQSVHEVRGVLTAVKAVSHWVKDTLEANATQSASNGAPKHMTEFNRRSVRATLEKYFEIEEEARFSKRWYSPDNLFLTLAPRPPGFHSS